MMIMHGSAPGNGVRDRGASFVEDVSLVEDAPLVEDVYRVEGTV